MAGTFSYTLAAGSVLTGGSQTLSVTFTPTDAADYTAVTDAVPLTVEQAMPTITWPAPTAITYGDPLSNTQLDATADVPGTFSYTPAAGTVLAAGSQTLSVTFTPTDSADYTPVTDTVPLTVGQATPTITWPAPAAITYGTPLGNSQLDSTANVAGTFSYSPAAGTVLAAGSQTLSVTFTPTDSADYTPVTDTVPLTVDQATPTIACPAPAAITYGAPLGNSQLDATASVAGTFSYTPAAGTVLTAGSQTLSVTFTPTDSADYTPVTDTVLLTVDQATPTIAWPAPAAIAYGDPFEQFATGRRGQRGRDVYLRASRGHGLGRRQPDALGHLHAHRLRRLHAGDGHGAADGGPSHAHDRITRASGDH